MITNFSSICFAFLCPRLSSSATIVSSSSRFYSALSSTNCIFKKQNKKGFHSLFLKKESFFFLFGITHCIKTILSLFIYLHKWISSKTITNFKLIITSPYWSCTNLVLHRFLKNILSSSKSTIFSCN